MRDELVQKSFYLWCTERSKFMKQTSTNALLCRVKTTERVSTTSMDLRAIVQVHLLELSARQVGLLLFNDWFCSNFST